MCRILLIMAFLFCSIFESNMVLAKKYQSAVFAGGCFWCMEADFEKLNGIVGVISGYTGGHKVNPSYKEVSSQKTGHVEAVKVFYDPKIISYQDLLRFFWRHIDPTDPYGQFVDRGSSYVSAIFYSSAKQKKLAEMSKIKLNRSRRFKKSIATKILPLERFYPAEKRHQNYYKKNPIRYKFYRYRSGRDKFLKKTWRNKPGRSELKRKLTSMQYKVTQKNGTEPPFKNEYWNNNLPGIYVDVVSGEPLFGSLDKLNVSDGWPNFSKPLVTENIVTKSRGGMFYTIVEVRSKRADSHLGEVIDDGYMLTGLRYRINSAALRFISVRDLEKEGYGEFSDLFAKKE